MDAASAGLLQELIRREGRSLLQYVSNAFPWITEQEQAALVQLQALVAEEREAAARLSRLLNRRRHIVPYLGAYPMAFTTINYVALEHLLPQLADYERRALADLENDLVRVTDPEARAEVQQIANMKRRHLQTLEQMAAAYPETFSTVRGRAP
jgi:hypothetical protein